MSQGFIKRNVQLGYPYIALGNNMPNQIKDSDSSKNYSETDIIQIIKSLIDKMSGMTGARVC